MALFLLIRHGHTEYVNRRIAGWASGIPLNEAGRAQAAALPERLRAAGVTRIVSSPLQRAVETAEPLARSLGLEIETREALGEIRYGDWTGLTYEELARDPRWKQFNERRSSIRCPGGEMMLEVQARVVEALEALRAERPDAITAIFSHGDALRSAVCHYAAIPLDLIHRIEVAPASVSRLVLEEWGPLLLSLNERG